MREGEAGLTRPRVGLALGSGGARGLAHIGVLKVLKQEGIPVDCIAGSSIGSLVGAVYAAGADLEQIENLAIHLKRNVWLDLTVPRRGFVTGEKVRELVWLLTKGKRLEELNIPTAVVATDLIRGERVVFQSGPADLAIRASISIPGIFEPVQWEGLTLVDGGVIDRIPITVVEEMGADIVIAVDVVPRTTSVRIQNIFDVITQTLGVMEREILNQRLLAADILIHPDLTEISPTAFTRVAESIRRGEEAARTQVERIKRLIDKRGGMG
ncbi:MAG: patatin-like phospholipase family protein [Firmicutes bacterium]|uniref:NTE family protein n=1 Tax=Melghirimyces thermohalophilus TaxID=1236220 RepID=A0A1G6NJY7_9BACL|nr:patatin-like phospholipase family protein [Melghirimyces thermohalophilus]MDA8352675.1 patatin-like phospholipase family protein [Bacillota bacterium]SDC67445.1 NTE family protein [Melghirimyces thermohalophilus]